MQGRAALPCFVVISLLAVPIPSGAQFPDECPGYVYLGNDPGGNDDADWSDNAQGIASDGEYWYFTNEGALYKYEANWHEVDGFDPGRVASRSIPTAMVDLGMDHYGDLDHYEGYLFVPFEDNKDDPSPPLAIIAVFRASDLAFLDWIDVTDHQRKAGWAAIQPVERVLYSSTNALKAENPLVRYALDLSAVENGIPGDFLTPITPMFLQASDGSPLDGTFTYMQGGVFSPLGDLYLVAGKSDEPVADVRGGIHLFRRTEDGSTFRHTHVSLNDPDAHPGTPDLVFAYEPAGAGGQEPEGIDWWNLDNDPNSEYSGQLHAILLHNQLGDDEIWLKHHAVDYFCTAGEDSDGDGVTDGDEVYVYNTHPLIPDRDRDGVEDELDNCPDIANADQSDLDGDDVGDDCDPDADGDGQTNADERTCGSDPFDVTDLSPDFDGDMSPDCIDADDDGDGQLDADEEACGSDPLDAADVSPDFDADGALDCLDPDDDNDGVADEGDRCPATLIPDPVIPAKGALKKNRYALMDGDLVFDDDAVGVGRNQTYTTMDTGGCNASQIAVAMGLGKSHYDYGITRSVLEAWISNQP